ncbi:MAG: hypothetical protein GTO67_11320 [Gammaproteobacteria bacterium]|nr:hypothetical protein [Gammaproteobacteria bacterium]NIN39194.1 hypothetical protein [Gammaproteobacteria bacterium]NIO26680.1 hypothetical protein [Gammaproteobacteria bacterium]NIO67236.1 hypothetical protein [Gammaproteobacteria bacterium]NIP48288.1 hypothetical protein [Gammaproteobacteria bacterium]
MFDSLWTKRALLLATMAWPGIAWSSDSAWHYTIDQHRQEQQANFCTSQEGVEEIAGIFHRYGPRTGYAALAESANCSVSVESFTPRKVLTSVTISEGKPGEYRVRFVEVENDRGDIIYLVTTREVVAE